MLFDYSWPGNVRELAQVVDHCRYVHGTIQTADLPSKISTLYDGLREYHDRINVRIRQSHAVSGGGADAYKDGLKGAVLTGRDKQHRALARREVILDALDASKWNVSRAAKKLKVPRGTLYRRMKATGIVPPRKVKVPS